ncbi:hypothetical protein [Vibrio mangrovi]|uniref:Uncharacterized protein n=1 Tax=Vibrio mangrovi TaxID=474394 RepID=A0A1Y6ITJ1_9VIBR|nr:hypothetical protein [Vibrio mangrovi]MDW6004684.1 hypothetical protein [Vibrio mangrovi]SMS00975.1 hypothetical protein VIM7927_02252 [Vibrio mangrovi]
MIHEPETKKTGKQKKGSHQRSLYWKYSPIYWPALSSEEAALKIPLKYVSDMIEITVLSPGEWQAFFSILYARKYQEYPDISETCLDDFLRQFSEWGIVAYAKTYNREIYLILQGYRKHLMTLLTSRYFCDNQPQILTLGLGALSIETDMSLATHVISSMEILIGGSRSMLQYLINDEQILSQLGLWHVPLLVQSVTTAGTSMALDESFPVSICVGLGLVLVSVSSPVWETDRKSAFAQKMAEKMSELVVNES